DNEIAESNEANNTASRTDQPPDLTVELLFPPAKVDCSGGPGNCNVRVDLKINNIGAGLAPGNIKYRVTAEGMPELTLSTGEGGAIAPGGSTGGFFVILGPGTDCFNPDCTVTVTVDPNNEVAESIEANNTAQRTDRGLGRRQQIPTPTPASFAVLSASASVTPLSFSGQCPTRFIFRGTITSNGVAGTASYRWPRSDGAIPPVENISFAAGETAKQVSTSWSLGGPGFTFSGWRKLEVLTPSAVSSNQANFSLSCQ
ncbi:MAG: hypothetical protein IH962_05230, partial [Chloroflexi bacterium]|nr:hypothetical protein [Chloroflexota bacterium]